MVKNQYKLNFKHAYFSLNSNISKRFCTCLSFPLNHHHMRTGCHIHVGIPHHSQPSIGEIPKVKNSFSGLSRCKATGQTLCYALNDTRYLLWTQSCISQLSIFLPKTPDFSCQNRLTTSGRKNRVHKESFFAFVNNGQATPSEKWMRKWHCFIGFIVFPVYLH